MHIFDTFIVESEHITHYIGKLKNVPNCPDRPDYILTNNVNVVLIYIDYYCG